MFKREQNTEPASVPEVQEPTPAPRSDLPIAFQDKAARRKRWPPVDRKALPPRLISFGTRTVYTQGKRGAPDRPMELEGACDAVNTSRTFWRHVGPNEPWIENDVSEQPANKVVETGITVRRHAPGPNGGTGKANVVTKFPPLTEAERAAAAVMRGIVGEVGT